MTSTQYIHQSPSINQAITPPKTPESYGYQKVFHNWPEPETEPEGLYLYSETKKPGQRNDSGHDSHLNVSHQEVLLLHGPKQRYAHTTEQPIPSLEDDREMLVAVEVIGLNPIDWKAPDFGFGLPALPCISGRDFAGKVVKPPRANSRFRSGDVVMGVSTDYRDSRKAAYQQYAVLSDFNACRLPSTVSPTGAAPLGVAYVAAALGLGICLGVNFANRERELQGPDLFRTIHSLPRDCIAQDVRAECFDSIREDERPEPGDWIAIWGGSSATGCCAVQLAKLAGLKVIAVIDVARSGERMLKHGADLLVDRFDTDRAISIVKGITKGKLRFGLDTRGKESTALLAQTMRSVGIEGKRAHLVGLTGLPKEPTPGVLYHSVPIKTFHEAPKIGEELMVWLERLFEHNRIATPEIEVAHGGLQGINAALDRLRDGSVNGPRIVVPLALRR
ncbi:hypothetical protein DSL72_003195 [Monilinia vaccinii-corymbosi]|uniref:Enoyl reductase (ER) domain-containing protein n=1 Tax=Monilinia vaccinii-corymbosi TaxID=61207 RepID=A0A8A3NSL0_9HELO|nr:hypothetical protein DSL72_003195 [Monilinia vaccinii-corymbosi]